ncbi:MAG: M28 family peptidase, partial [Sediminibacterium sp.]
ISESSKISIGGQNFPLWKEALISQTGGAHIDAPLLFVNKEDIAKTDIKGKAVAIAVSAEGNAQSNLISARRYLAQQVRRFSTDVFAKGAVALVLIADPIVETNWKLYVAYSDRGTYDIEGGANEKVTDRVPIIWLHSKAIDLVKQPGQILTAHINIEHFQYPSVNVVGKIEGTDAKLKQEYVLFSGHQDHDGVRNTANADSIYNGADDNASVSVALLAIARAFYKQKGKRSALFVWHGAEERGLLGSKWYAQHPTVDKSSIVAVLNGDMIGRNTPDSAALLGSQSPHKNSNDLVNMAMEANNEGPKFKLDTLWDKVQHPEGWYFRSDHLSYARVGIPALFYTTLLHPDYHTPLDEADRIDTKKLTRVTEWMYRTGWKVANTDARPRLVDGFKLER